MDRTIRSRTVQYDHSQALLLEERMYSFQREIEENNQLKFQQQVCPSFLNYLFILIQCNIPD